MAWTPHGGGQGPWGRGPSGGGPQPPDIEELLRRGQDTFKRFMPGGAGSARGIALAVLVAIMVWMVTGFYRVEPGEQGVELLFGKFVKVTTPGLNYWFPAPIGEAITPNVERTNQINIGFRAGETVRGATARDVPQESMMLTGDQNIFDVDFIVQWRIKNAAEFLFSMRDPEGTVKIASESAMREVVGQTPLDEAMTTRRQAVETRAKELLQRIMDDYQSGVLIIDMKLQKADPPQEVIDAFNDVQRAKQDQERLENEALAYRNDIVPRARGQAQRVTQEAAAYRERVIKEAEGEASRFLAVYETYANAKDVTKRRLYLETMQQVLRGSEKVLLDIGPNNPGVVPYLPLNELQKPATGGTR